MRKVKIRRKTKAELQREDLRLKWRIVDKMADADLAPHFLVGNMEAVFRWLKEGTVPKKDETPKLKAVVSGQ